MPESNVAISAGSGTNIRTVTVNVDNSALVTGGQVEQQQVMTLADSTGNLLNFTKGALPVVSEELVVLLKAMIIRLDLLCFHIDRTYKPPDNLGF